MPVVKATAPLLAGFGRSMLRLDFAANGLTQMFVNSNDIGFDASADVNLTDIRRIERCDIGRDHVADVNVITRLLAIAVDHRDLAVEQQGKKNRHDAGFTVWRLPRSVDVGIAQRNVRQAERLMIIRQIKLAGPFAHAIGTRRLRAMAFRRRKNLLLAVYRAAGRREHNFFHAGVLAPFQKIDETKNVHPRIERGISNGSAHIHLRRVMTKRIRLDFLNQSDRFAVGDVDDMQIRLEIEIDFLTGREIIEDMHLMAALDVGIANMRGDEAHAACDNNFHLYSVSFERKYSMVFCSPSSRFTFGSQPRISLALLISGWRTCGSSSGRGL